MAYEVTKLVNGRPYRYRVRSERDPATGKTRNRWTYLGRGDGGEPAAAKPRANAREALLDALNRLLDGSDPGDVTAGAVSVEAGLAHGTFYRYFKNLNAAIRALAERLRDEKAAEFSLIDETPADLADARARLRAWTGVVLRTRTRYFGLVRALLALAQRDEELRAAVLARREASALRLSSWLCGLRDRGLVALDDPEAAGSVLYAMLDGFGRESIMAGEPLEEKRIVAAIELVDRAVFGA